MHQDTKISGCVSISSLSRQMQPPPGGWDVPSRTHTIS
jgi:hypothetical protein